MQRRLFIVIGIVLAILAVAGVAVVLLNQGGGIISPPPPSEPAEGAPTPEVIPTVEVIVARQPVARGGEFPPGSLGRITYPETQRPPNAITNEAETIGQIAKIEIAPGQIILRDYLRPKTAGPSGEAAFETPAGHVLVAFPIDRQSSVAYAVQTGDFVDVLMTVSFVDLDPEFQTVLPNKFSFITTEPIIIGEEVVGTQISIDPSKATDEGRLSIENEDFPGFEFPAEAQRPRRVAQLTVQKAKVVKVGSWLPEPTPAPIEEGAPPPTPAAPDIVSLAVTPQDALVLLWARQTKARMELALRAAGDENADHSTEAVTLQYMLTRFSIAVPPRLEFAIDKSEEPAPTPTPLPPPPPSQ
jgi:Flp pilus assembly protein CpaB